MGARKNGGACYAGYGRNWRKQAACVIHKAAFFVIIFLGPLHQEKQLEPDKILKALVYAAAEAGAIRLIETIFSLPAGRVFFECYKEESSLPEDIAEENGHGKAAAYLRDKTKRSVDVLCTLQSLIASVFSALLQ